MKKVKIKQVLKRANKKDLDIVIDWNEKYGGQTCITGARDIILNGKEVIVKSDVPELTDYVPYQNIRLMKCYRK